MEAGQAPEGASENGFSCKPECLRYHLWMLGALGGLELFRGMLTPVSLGVSQPVRSVYLARVKSRFARVFVRLVSILTSVTRL